VSSGQQACMDEGDSTSALQKMKRNSAWNARKSPKPPVAMPDEQIVLGAWTPSALGVPENHMYSIMIDAGSTGTRAEIYFQQNLTQVPLSKEEKASLSGGGITDFEADPCGAVPFIQGLLQNASKIVVPQSTQADTPVWLRGTAGLRLESPAAADPILDCLNLELSKPGATSFAWQDAKIASGDMEAVYGYLAIAHFYGSDAGSLEMGGASAQVSFEPTASVLNNEFVIGGSLSIYAKSYMRFGQDQGLFRSYELQIQQWREKVSILQASAPCPTVLLHPCLPVGLIKTHYATDGHNYTFEGTSDSEGCREITMELMHLNYECTMSPCAMMGVYQPTVKYNSKFKAYSAYYRAVTALSLLDDGESKVISPGDIAGELRNYCSLTLVELGLKGPTTYSQYACFNGWFAYSMLTSEGFQDDSMKIEFVPDVSWTLGALIYYTSDEPSTDP